MSRWVCKMCIAQHGLKGSELCDWPEQGDVAAIRKHIEGEHHIPVRRDGETEDQAQERFLKEYPEAGGPNCKCPTCVSIRRYKAARA